MAKITTAAGFEIEIDEAAYDDWELLEDLVAYDNGSGSALISAFKRLAGEENYKAIKENLRKNGRVSRSAMETEFTSLFDAKRKNS